MAAACGSEGVGLSIIGDGEEVPGKIQITKWIYVHVKIASFRHILLHVDML